MKLFLALSCLVAVALAEVPILKHYHENEGIQRAEEIRQAEQAIDFDGARIVGGSQANLGQYPYMGGLVITLTTGATSVCGSSLIAVNRVLTASHCWFDGSNQARLFVVVFGSLTLFSGGIRITTTNVRMHPNWNPNTIVNDVAVGIINSVPLSSTVNVIPMASGSNLYVGSWAFAAGFGRQSDSSGISTSQTLHHVSLQVISNPDCQRVFGTTSVIDSTICTSGAGGRSTCGGDSGGPLVIGGQLVGCTSFGARAGCSLGFPAAFARVSAFFSWINAQL